MPRSTAPLAEALVDPGELDRQAVRLAALSATVPGACDAWAVEQLEGSAHGVTAPVWWAGCQARQRRSSWRVRMSASLPSSA